MKNRRPVLQTRGGEEKGLSPKNQGSYDYKKMISQKIEAKRARGLHIDRPLVRGGRNQSPEDPIQHIQSTKNDVQVRLNKQRYFRKDQEQIKPRTTLSQDNKLNNKATSNEKDERSTGSIERTNSQYFKLHDKLNFLESKISEMKNNLQKKKQEKINKQKQKEAKENQRKQKKSKLGAIVTSVPQRKELHAFERDPYSPRHNIYYVSQIVRAYKDYKSLAREHLQTTLQIMAYFQRMEKPSDSAIAHKKVKLPRRKGYQDKKTVVFDLDETLIHCNQNLETPYDVKLPITFPTGEIIQAGINIRPHAIEILQNLSSNFEVIVFTASHSCYANVVIDFLDPEKKYVHHRLFREHCYATSEGMHVKDLRVIDRQLSTMVLIDNAAYSYAHQYDNGIPIIPYYHGNTDFQLKALQNYLQSMLLVKDMRATNRRTFKLHEYHNYYDNLEKLVDELYVTQHNS